jgi:hypothetical protein
MFILTLLSLPEVIALFVTTALYLILQYFIHDDQPYPGFKIVGGLPGDWFGIKTKKPWDEKALEIMQGDHMVSWWECPYSRSLN